MHWAFLGIAIVSEVVATLALTASGGFTKLWPSMVVVVGYSNAFFWLSLALKTVPVGIVYALWAGLGIVLVSIVGAILFEQKLDGAAVIGIGLIVTGVLVMNLFSEAVGR